MTARASATSRSERRHLPNEGQEACNAGAQGEAHVAVELEDDRIAALLRPRVAQRQGDPNLVRLPSVARVQDEALARGQDHRRRALGCGLARRRGARGEQREPSQRDPAKCAHVPSPAAEVEPQADPSNRADSALGQ